jgi:hypothetical protein
MLCFNLAGMSNEFLARFHQAMRDADYTRPWDLIAGNATDDEPIDDLSAKDRETEVTRKGAAQSSVGHLISAHVLRSIFTAFVLAIDN